MKKNNFLFSFIYLALATFSECGTTGNDCEPAEGAIQVPFFSLSSSQEFMQCRLGNYGENTQWVLRSASEFQELKDEITCLSTSISGVDNIDFDESIVLIGFISHPNTGIELESEDVIESCQNNEVRYTVKFKILPTSFAALTTRNYGVVIPKTSNKINFKINQDAN